MPYRDLPQDELVRQYNPRAAVPDHEVWKYQWAIASEAVRRRHEARLRVPYGPTPGQTLDVFPAARAGAPVNVFIHGGFWRFLDSFDHHLVVPPVLETGAASVSVNYDLCPTVPLTEVVDQVRRALAFVHANATGFGADPDRLHVSGHSAGAHLTAMAVAEGAMEAVGLPGDAVKGATVVSALFDLWPMLEIPGGEDLRLTPETVPPMSPLFTPPAPGVPLVLAVGGRETEEWIRQTEAMADLVAGRGNPVRLLKPEADHHYSILLSLANPVTDLCRAMLDQMESR